MTFSVDQLARLPLAPLLALQAIHVRRTALNLPEPSGPRSGCSGVGPTLRLLILGDSSAAGVGAETQESALSGALVSQLAKRFTLNWRLEAETGATTKTSLAKLDSLPPHPFDIVLLVHGVNDTTRLTSQRHFKARQTTLIEALRTRHNVQHFILSGVPPLHHFPLLPQPLRWVLGCHAARLDQMLAMLAAERPDCTHLALNLPYTPEYIARDGFHPSQSAYLVWSEMIAQAIYNTVSSDNPANSRQSGPK